MEDHVQRKIEGYYTLAHYHMLLAYRLQDDNQSRTSLQLCNSAFLAMLRALCWHENRFKLHANLSMLDLIACIHTDTNPGDDLLIHYTKLSDLALGPPPGNGTLENHNLDHIIRQTDMFLNRLFSRISGLHRSWRFD
ncbi:hypothetical protein D3P07_19450 [Paenibacillus sp. 1011MAR3C5]|uniref:hypothetical protein n=1 Tax=Paenibacillus sp. 1011MAR3C5 TaxID=1675787 RepID=UPI000E6CD2D3|nr:hypothetical protein [Paenibacillus sp. 1011MAR3C5]RJE86250.1 hypothetical protein D3P07_19450 [Paenibacillus sp. 1011MAR3C5]